MPPLIPQATIAYKTYVKESLVEALQPVFVSHSDTLLRRTKVGVDFSTEETRYPAVIVRFYERGVRNAGVGHNEWFESFDHPGKYIRFKHYLYNGDIEFAVYALSTYDRDLVADSLVQTIAMGDLEVYTNQFFQRIYEADPVLEPISQSHFVNLNSDQINGFGESQVIAPWEPEDVMVYQTSYRVGIFGEFYSLPPKTQEAVGVVEQVDLYPYDSYVGEPTPNPHPEDLTPWEGEPNKITPPDFGQFA